MKIPTGQIRKILFCAATAYLFFHSWWSLIALIPYTLYSLYQEREYAEKRRKKELEEQFRDGLQCLLASLEAGYSVENSFRNAAADLRMMFEDDAPIVQEFQKIVRKLQSGSTIEVLLEEFGQRSGVEDIINFAGIFQLAKKSGGDLIRVVRSITDTLYQKQEVQREISTILFAKQLEVTIMTVMPYGILLYFRVFSAGFLDPLYHTTIGTILMTIIFLLYCACCKYARFAAQIQV